MLNNTIAAGLNNPECAFFVGNTLGSLLIYMWVILVILSYFVFKMLYKLVLKSTDKQVKSKRKRKKDH